MKFGISVLRERGSLERVYAAWEGKEVFSNTENDKIVLSPGQVVLVYIIMGLAVLSSLSMLAGEKIWTLIKSSRHFQSQVDKISRSADLRFKRKVHIANSKSEAFSNYENKVGYSRRRKKNQSNWAVNYSPF